MDKRTDDPLDMIELEARLTLGTLVCKCTAVHIVY